MSVGKILVMNASAQLTAAVLSGQGSGTLPIDPKIADPNLRAKDLEAWEVNRIFYHAICGALNDGSWPEPKIDLSGLVGTLGNLLTPDKVAGLAGLVPGLGPIVQALLPLLKPATPTPTVPTGTPIPDPGTQPAKAA